MPEARRWNQFAAEAPELEMRARRELLRAEVMVLATLRQDGRPRLSLVEPVFVDNALFVATSGQDVKTADLRSDPRCTIQSATSDRTHSHRVFTAYCRASEVTGDGLKMLLETAKRPEMGWKPEAAFQLLIESVHYPTSTGLLTWPPRV